MRENTAVLRQIATKATVGTKLTEQTIVAAANLIAGSPKWTAGNLLPSDHAGVLENGKLTLNPSQSAQRADYLFAKVGRGLYEVVPVSAHVPMPQTSGSRGKVDPAVAMAEARKLLGIAEPKQETKQTTENKPVSK